MKLRDRVNWDHLREDDLTYNNVRLAPWPPRLREFKERLRRKRYIGDATKDVRAALLCCRPP